MYYNNRLCKVTSAIASGNTLTIGTNIAYTTLGEELTSHLKATNGDEFYFDYKDGEPGYYPSASKTASQFVPIGGTTLEELTFTKVSSTNTYKYTVSGCSAGELVFSYAYLADSAHSFNAPTVTGGNLEYRVTTIGAVQALIIRATDSTITVTGSKANTSNVKGIAYGVM